MYYIQPFLYELVTMYDGTTWLRSRILELIRRKLAGTSIIIVNPD